MTRLALRRETHPNALKALEKHRQATQIGGPNAPPKCAKCGRLRWKKSPKGLCWFHAAGPGRPDTLRPSLYGQQKRWLNRARYIARQDLDKDPPTPEEMRHAATVVSKLKDRYDRPRLEQAVRDLMRGRIDHRTYRERLRPLMKETTDGG